MTQITDKMIAQNKVERFVSRFQPSYHWLASHAALPLVLTPELVNYLRVQFLKSEGVPWIAEADLLLSELCRPVGYEQYIMDKTVRAYLLDELKKNQKFGSERIKQIAYLLITYIQHLDKTNPFITQSELQTQRWGAMLYFDTEKTVYEIAQAISQCVNKVELARLLKITEDFKQEIASSGKFDTFLEYAQLSNDLLRKPETVKSEQIKSSYSVAGLQLTLPESVIQAHPILGLESFETQVKIATVAFLDPLYHQLDELLKNQQFKEADDETYRLIVQTVGKPNFSEKDIPSISCDVLLTINSLWEQYSEGKFGFRKQVEICQKLGGIKNKYDTDFWDQFRKEVNWPIPDIINRLDQVPPGNLPYELLIGFREGAVLSRFMACEPELSNPNLNTETEEPLQQWTFQTPTVNSRGETIKTTTHTASYFTETLTDNVILEMVAIPGGTFTMGSPENEGYEDEWPQHDVTLSPFFMGKYPITQAQWKAIASRTDLKVNIDLDEDPSNFKDPYQKDQETRERWLRPVENINWYEAVEFCKRLSKLTGRDYQLPSEAQWEYACRAIISDQLSISEWNSKYCQPFSFGETITGELANYHASNTYADAPQGEYREETTPVGQFPPNAFGLYDMHGNVWEWCADDWHSNYDGAPTDGSAWVDDEKSNNLADENMEYSTKNDDNELNSVLRGGSWGYVPDNCRSAIRLNLIIGRDDHDNDNGFRVVCVFGRTL